MTEAPALPSWPDLSACRGEENRDVLMAAFGIASDELLDDANSFCDA